MSQPKIVDVRARAETEPILFISRNKPQLPGRKPTSSANYSQWKKKQIGKDKKAKTHANGFGFNERVGGPTEPFEEIKIKRPNLLSMARDDVFNTGHTTDVLHTRTSSNGPRGRAVVRLSLNPDLPRGFAPKPLGMNLTTSGGGGPTYNNNRNLMNPPMSPLKGGDGKNIFATLQKEVSPRDEPQGYGEARDASPEMKSPWQRSPSPPKEELSLVTEDEVACLTARKSPMHYRPLSGQKVRIRQDSPQDQKPQLLIKLPEKFQCSLHKSSTSFHSNMTEPNISKKSLHSTPSLSSLRGTLEGAYEECDSIKCIDRAPSCPPGKIPITSNLRHSLGRRTRLPKEQIEKRDSHGFDLRRPQKYSEHLSYTSLPESMSISSEMETTEKIRSQSAFGFFTQLGNGRPVTLPEGWTIKPPKDVQKILFQDLPSNQMGRTI